MAAHLHRLPLPATFGVRADGTTWISLGDPAKPPHMQFDGPPCAKAAAEIVSIINAAPLAAKALIAVRAACRDPDTDTALPSAVGEAVEAALAMMGERS
ncbi:hypothetical protein ACQKJ1_05190 [Methylorubrum rhodesianum]|uniref:hypothetical protein n=1 Tax=Methylorubrum rhodesianum TaxID=29427 RepID=UPI003D0814AE